MEALLKELVDSIQRLEKNERLKKLDARLCRLEEQLRGETLTLQQILPSPKMEGKLSEMKELLEDQTDRITEQVETKLRRLERQRQDQNNLAKWELLAELMIIEQNLPSPQASQPATLIGQEAQTNEAPHSTTEDAELRVEELPATVEDVVVPVRPASQPATLIGQEAQTNEDEEKRWKDCGTVRVIRRACCRRETAVVAREDGTLEFYSSGKVVGRYSELTERFILKIFCSDEYIGVWLSNHSMACYRWLSDRLEWLYCLYMDGQTWRKAESSDVRSGLEDYYYRHAQDVVCCLYEDKVSGWSLGQNRTVFNIEAPGAKDLHVTPELLLVGVCGMIDVFSLEGSKLYCILGVVGGHYINPPLYNTNYTAFVSVYPSSVYVWPTTRGRPVTKIEAFDSVLHPDLPHLCFRVKDEPWELVLKHISTNSVIWRRPGFGSFIRVFSTDSELLLIEPRYSPIQVLRWSSGEVVAALSMAGERIRSVSPQYIISDKQVLYRDLTTNVAL